LSSVDAIVVRLLKKSVATVRPALSNVEADLEVHLLKKAEH
jgi:hypothetical protein